MKCKVLSLLLLCVTCFMSEEAEAGKFIIRGGQLYYVNDSNQIYLSSPQHYSQVTGRGAYESTRYHLGVRWYNPWNNMTYGHSYLGPIGGHYQSWCGGCTTRHYDWGVGRYWHHR